MAEKKINKRLLIGNISLAIALVLLVVHVMNIRAENNRIDQELAVLVEQKVAFEEVLAEKQEKGFITTTDILNRRIIVDTFTSEVSSRNPEKASEILQIYQEDMLVVITKNIASSFQSEQAIFTTLSTVDSSTYHAGDWAIITELLQQGVTIDGQSPSEEGIKELRNINLSLRLAHEQARVALETEERERIERIELEKEREYYLRMNGYYQ